MAEDKFVGCYNYFNLLNYNIIYKERGDFWVVKTFFLDLSNLRFGILKEIKPQPNVDGRVIIKYRPLNSLFCKEIANVPKNAIIDVTKEELGGLSDAEHFKILITGERGESDFLDRILSIFNESQFIQES